MDDALHEDMIEILELREKQLTEMIKVLQKKRRDVRAAVYRLKAETLRPINMEPVAEESSHGNNEVCVDTETYSCGVNPCRNCPN